MSGKSLLEPVSKYVREHADKPQLLSGALETVEPFFANADRGTYDLEPAAGIDRFRTAKILNFALGRPVGEVIAVSAASPRAEIRQHLRKTGGDPLSRAVRSGLGDALRPRLGDERWNGLWAALTESLRFTAYRNYPWDRLYQSIASGLRGAVSNEIANTLRTGVWMSAFCHLGYAMIGDAAAVERMNPLMRLLPRHLPLVERQDKPASWIVLGS